MPQPKEVESGRVWVIESFKDEVWKLCGTPCGPVYLACAFHTKNEAESALNLKPHHTSQWKYRIRQYNIAKAEGSDVAL